jgi:hypothetical protein
MGWKIFAAFLVISSGLTLSGLIADASVTPLYLFSAAFTLVVTAGVCLYAFDMTLGPSIFWRVTEVAHVLYMLVVFAILAFAGQRLIGGSQGTAAVLLMLALLAPLSYFAWLALHRQARKG